MGEGKIHHRPSSHNLGHTLEHDNRRLYAQLEKAEATTLFLLRIEVIDLNAWLAAIGVPNTHPSCSCGWSHQTVRHILIHCPNYERRELIQACGTKRLDDILNQPTSAAHAGRWLIASGSLEQFRTARDIQTEDFSSYRKTQELSRRQKHQDILENGCTDAKRHGVWERRIGCTHLSFTPREARHRFSPKSVFPRM
jgi:hypothetical protein